MAFTCAEAMADKTTTPPVRLHLLFGSHRPLVSNIQSNIFCMM